MNHIQRLTLTALLLMATLVATELSQATELPMTVRLFVGKTDVNPDDLNTELETQTLKHLDSLFYAGVEATHSPFSHLEWGLRYLKRYAKNDEQDPNNTTDYFSELQQDSFLFVVRIPFIKSTLFRADLYGGMGGSNTKLKLKSSTQEGTLTRQETNGWLATPCSSFGGSLAFGFKNFYFFVEGGMETNKVGKLTRTGTVNSNVETIDLSGPYIAVGFLFDGLTPSKSKK